MSYNKRFSRQLCDKYDGKGKQIAEQIMKDVAGAKLSATNTAEEQGDFSQGFWDQKYLMGSGDSLLVESEMKNSKWWGKHHGELQPFKYGTMDIPFRKVKNKADVHIVISTCENYAFIVARKAMDKAIEEGGAPKMKTTKYEPEGAYYFSTPVSKGRFVSRQEDGKWKFLDRP